MQNVGALIAALASCWAAGRFLTVAERWWSLGALCLLIWAVAQPRVGGTLMALGMAAWSIRCLSTNWLIRRHPDSEAARRDPRDATVLKRQNLCMTVSVIASVTAALALLADAPARFAVPLAIVSALAWSFGVSLGHDHAEPDAPHTVVLPGSWLWSIIHGHWIPERFTRTTDGKNPPIVLIGLGMFGVVMFAYANPAVADVPRAAGKLALEKLGARKGGGTSPSPTPPQTPTPSTSPDADPEPGGAADVPPSACQPDAPDGEGKLRTRLDDAVVRRILDAKRPIGWDNVGCHVESIEQYADTTYVMFTGGSTPGVVIDDGAGTANLAYGDTARSLEASGFHLADGSQIVGAGPRARAGNGRWQAFTVEGGACALALTPDSTHRVTILGARQTGTLIRRLGRTGKVPMVTRSTRNGTIEIGLYEPHSSSPNGFRSRTSLLLPAEASLSPTAERDCAEVASAISIPAQRLESAAQAAAAK